jgi:hypothetical protein
VTDAVGNPLGDPKLPLNANIADLRAIVIDTTSPIAPAITAVWDDVGTVTGNVVSGGVTNDSMPTVSGTAEAFATVTLTAGSTPVGSITANASGQWSIVTSKLPEGVASLTATAVDAAGNSSPPSTAFTVLVDTVAPATPTIGSIDNTTIGGLAEAGSLVTIRRAGGAVIDSVIAQSNGSWIYRLSLPDGTYSLTVTATDDAGNASASSAPTSITVDTVAPGAPIIADVYDDVPLTIGSVANGGLTNDAMPRISGTAEAGSVVTLLAGGATLGTVTATNAGAWSITPAILADATYAVSAFATDASGNISASSLVRTFAVDTLAPQVPTISMVTDNVDPVQGPVSSGGSTNDSTPTASGTADAGTSITLQSGSTVLGTATADGSGRWSITSAALPDAAHSLVVTSADQAGNTTSSAAFPLTVDTKAPSIPTIALIESDVPPRIGPVANGGLTNDNQLRVSGNAEPNSRVTFWTDYGTPSAANIVTMADASGRWAVTTPVLTDGQHAFAALARDAAGNRSGLSATSTAKIDTTAPRVAALTTTLASGTYGVGQTVVLRVQFTEPVQVAGIPMLVLNTVPPRFATFVGLTSDNTARFRYVSSVGDIATRLDIAGVTAFSMNGGSVRDLAGNAANVSLPAPGTPGSLSNTAAIAIDGSIKAAAGDLTTDPATAPRINRSRLSIPITFNTPVTGFTLASIKLFLADRSVSLSGATLTGSGTSYILNLSAATTSLPGLYRLRIGGTTAGILAGGVAMNTPTNLYWWRI